MMKKIIAITGATGGLGNSTTKKLASLGYDMIFVDRNQEKSKKWAEEIKKEYPSVKIEFVKADFSNFQSIKEAIEKLSKKKIDCLILNSGIYNVKIEKLESGYNNIFQVNYLYPYFMARTLLENGSVKKVVAVGSIAHFKAKADEKDIDYSNKKQKMKIYGNSKKFLMYSLYDLKKNQNLNIAIAHPGITSTNMTTNYPKWIRWLVKGMTKLMFDSPKKTCLNIVKAVEENCDPYEWIGPRTMNIWGKPKKKTLKPDKKEVEFISQFAENFYKTQQKN